MILEKTTIEPCQGGYKYKDIFGRYWHLIIVLNPSVQLPFLVKPISKEKFDELSKGEKK